MACDTWRNKIDGYSDGELSSQDMRAMGEHLKDCASCTSDLLSRAQLKLAVRSAGKRFSPSPELRQRVLPGLPAKSKPVWRWNWMSALAVSAAFIAVISVLVYRSSSVRQDQALAELADLHVATLASGTPVDVVSTDRHTVKPWFEGKIPFTFNLPELAGTPFILEGGRMAYLDQSPGAQLIFTVGKHRISVFIFQNHFTSRIGSGDSRSRRVTFNVETWMADDLRYVVIGDVDPNDIQKLSELLKMASK